MIQQEAMCVNDNGLEVDYNRCALTDAPGPVQCPAMPPCEQPKPTLEYIGTKYLTVGHGHKKHGFEKHHGPPALPFKQIGHGKPRRHGKYNHGSVGSFETSSSLLSSSSGYAGYGRGKHGHGGHGSVGSFETSSSLLSSSSGYSGYGRHH
jgi:hypothetical protein